jgi:hypothetical protein
MKKVIELLESAKESINLAISCKLLLLNLPATDYINEAITELKALPCWETPEEAESKKRLSEAVCDYRAARPCQETLSCTK